MDGEKICPDPLYLLKTLRVTPESQAVTPSPLILTGPKGEGVSPTFLGAAGLGRRPSCSGCGGQIERDPGRQVDVREKPRKG